MSSVQRVQALDRALKTVLPAAIEHFAPPPCLLADGIWIVERHLRLPPALRLPTNMTILRLRDGGLAIHAPVHIDPGLLAAVRELGEVVALIAPNTFHYSYVAEWVDVFPGAALYAAPGLAERVPQLPASIPLSDQPAAPWAGEIEQIVYGPIGPFSEVAFLHRATRTLLLSDLAFHLTRFDSWLQKLGWRLMGVPAGFGPSRSARMTLLRERTQAQPYLRRIAAWDFERIVVAHGEVVPSAGNAVFRRGFSRYL